MSWRKIQKEDIVRGALIRMTSLMNDGAYCMATIISIRNIDDETYPHIQVARPYLYAHKDFNSNGGLMGQEVFDIGMDKLLGQYSDTEVFQGRDNIRNMTI